MCVRADGRRVASSRQRTVRTEVLTSNGGRGCFRQVQPSWVRGAALNTARSHCGLCWRIEVVQRAEEAPCLWKSKRVMSSCVSHNATSALGRAHDSCRTRSQYNATGGTRIWLCAVPGQRAATPAPLSGCVSRSRDEKSNSPLFIAYDMGSGGLERESTETKRLL